jgi:hypothetical protein
MIENLLPENIETLRALYRAAYANRPALLAALESVLDSVLETVWDGEGTYTQTYDRLNAEFLPVLIEASDPPVSHEEEAVTTVLLEWQRIAPTLEHP